MKRIAATLLSIIIFAGCEDNGFDPVKDNFFPLQIGNYWELRPLDQNPLNDQTVIKKKIVSSKSFSGDEYYLMITSSEGPVAVYVDSAYYRIDRNGFVFQRYRTGEIVNPYRLGADDGDRWRLSSTSKEKDMSVMYYKDPVEISSTQIADCRLFSFDVKEWIDEESYTTLAPGIGIVSMYSAWGFHKELRKAIIDGVEYNF